VGALPLQRGLDGRTDPGQIALEQVVGCAGLHASDGRLLVHRAGDDEEGDAWRPLPGQRERGHAVEAGKGVVGEDQIGAEFVELVEECVSAIDSAGEKRNTSLRELILHELGVHRHILENQNSERVFRHADPVRCGAAPCRATAHNPIY